MGDISISPGHSEPVPREPRTPLPRRTRQPVRTPPLGSTPRDVAVLDMDGTLLRGSLADRMVRALAASGRCDEQAMRAAQAALRRYSLDGAHTAVGAQDSSRCLGEAVRGLCAALTAELAWQVWEEARQDLHHFARPLVDLLHAHGLSTLLITGCFDPLAQAAAADLGISAARGAVAEVADGRHTGAFLRFPALPGGKFAALREAVGEEHSDGGPALAMGNSTGDAELLSRAALPIAFQPTPALLCRARHEGWRITDAHDVLAVTHALLTDRHPAHQTATSGRQLSARTQ